MDKEHINISQIRLQPAQPAAHFADIAAMMNTLETEPNTAESLNEWYKNKLEVGVYFTVALAPSGYVLGFNGIYRANTNIERSYSIYLIVCKDVERQGLGGQLYDLLLGQANDLGARVLRVRVRDDCERGIHFAHKRGFVEKKHSIEMMLDLGSWEDQRYTPIIRFLEAEGFRFTNMAELGDTRDARRMLYNLNNSTAATDPGSDGIPPWATFEEFEQDVCNSSWYHPDAQIIAIDTHTDNWAAMSAITVFAGSDHAFNLFTGTDIRYRRRKLAQAVKTIALCRARNFGVGVVRTSHNSENAAMIAIDNKLGYIRTPGVLIMEKELEIA